MSLKNIELSEGLLTELYKNVLVTGVATERGERAQAFPEDTSRAGSDPGDLPGFGENIRIPSVNTKGSDEDASSLPYRFLGKNQKRITVIARYAQDPYIPEDHLQFLIKILSACKLNLGDVAIINDSSAAAEISKLKKELDPKYVLMFDIKPDEIGLPLSFPVLKAQVFDGCTFLTIPSIAALNGDDDTARGLKKQLWDCLRKMFPATA
jgi:hypothetical protein